MSDMMWGMGLLWLLIIVVLVLAAAALVKYLFFGKRVIENSRPSVATAFVARSLAGDADTPCNPHQIHQSCFSPKRGVSFAGKINKAAVGWGRSNIPKSGRIASGLISCRINLI
jgi:hypothetical protein